MATPTLTQDQAQLLWRHLGGWMLAATMVDPDYGMRSVKARVGGCSWSKGSHPELPYNHTQTRGNGIVGYNIVGPFGSEHPAVAAVSHTGLLALGRAGCLAPGAGQPAADPDPGADPVPWRPRPVDTTRRRTARNRECDRRTGFMKAVWLSSTYYLDEAVQQLSPNAERMLTRALAFCGNAESSGYLSELNITMLGLPNPKKLVRELVNANIFVARDSGGYDFRSWEAWNSSGDKLIARQKADRDRQARRRQEQRKSRERSRETSRDVTDPEESREEQNSGYVPNASTDSNAGEPRSAPVSPDAWKLVRDLIPAEHPQAVRTELALQVTTLLKTGTTVELAAEAVQLWLTKNVHPKTLPSLVSEVINTRNRPAINGNGAKTPPSKRKVNAALDLANRFAQQPPDQPALEA